MSVVIPRVIHRIWLGGDMPPEFAQFGETWAEHHPGWEMRLWTEANLPRLRNQVLFDRAPDLFDSAQVPRFRSDVARLEILHQYGGLYVDTDFVACRSIEPLIAGLDLFAAEEKPGLIANGLMGSVPGHPFLDAMIAGLPTSVRQRPSALPWRVSGPEYLTHTSRRRQGELALLPRHLIYPYHHTQLDRTGSPPPIADDVVCHHVWASIRRSVSVILPYRDGCLYRRQNRDWVREFYRLHYPSWQVVECDEPGDPFSKAAAIRDGVRRSFGDVLVIADADLIVTNLRAAVAAVAQGQARWAIPHMNVHRLAWDATKQVLTGTDPRAVANRTAERIYRGLIGGGLVVIDRATFESCPPDPRFRGWGGEDEAWGLALQSLVGQPWRGHANLLHLWHPPAPRMERLRGNTANENLVMRYRNAKTRPAMRSLVDEHIGDDHG